MIDLAFLAGVILFLAGAVIPLATISQGNRLTRSIYLGCIISGSIVFSLVSLFVLVNNVPVSIHAWQIFPGVKIGFFIDRLAAFFLFLIGSVSACVALYCAGYVEEMEGGNRRNLFFSGISIFILAMSLIVTSENTFSFLLFWELMAAVSFFLVMYEYNRSETRRAGIFYFVMTQLSTLFVMMGIIILFFATGSFAFAHAPVNQVSAPLLTAAFISLFIGFSIKAGIIPFHKWLPYAHPASPSPVSALMSGVMLKVAVYGLVRFLVTVFTPDLWWGVLILVAGTTSAVLGVIYAIKEDDIKGLLAYSSIENLGIIFVGIGLFVIFSASGLSLLATISLLAALFHSLNHAVFKSLLFLSSGSVVHAVHTRDMEKMGGLAKQMPVTSLLFFIGAAAIAALPPLNGFASELLVYTAFFESVSVINPLLKILLFICLALFALTSALSAACFVKAFGSIFLAKPRSPACEKAHEASLSMLAGPAILAAACGILGVFSYQILTGFGFVLPVPDLLVISIVLLLMGGLVYLGLYFTSSRQTRIGETWGCGAPSLPSSTEYTGHGFSEPIVTIFSSIYRTGKTSTKTYFDQKNCMFAEGTAEIRLVKFFEEYLYLPVARGAYRGAKFIARMQNGCLDTYLMYVFVAVVAILIILGVTA